MALVQGLPKAYTAAECHLRAELACQRDASGLCNPCNRPQHEGQVLTTTAQRGAPA